jgi:molybdate transport system substrate-binding protein
LRATIRASTHCLYDALKPRLVIAENIGQAAQYVSSGNADLGLISLTSALALRGTGRYIPIPSQNYPPIVQGAIVVRNSTNEQAAHKFLDFLASPVIVRQLQAGGLSPAQ